ncbi:MAG: Ca-activated chloride channel family protein [Chloroflexi bacterium]|nr:MAG: Ca-activated chloride channel family protein [Chloroflexota bacterium]
MEAGAMTHPLAQFADAPLLLLLLAAAFAAALSLWTLRRRAHHAARLLNRGGGRVLIGNNAKRDLYKFGLITLVVALLALALARPQAGDRTRELEQQGIAIVVALDVSLSMAAEDALPNRMRAAQRELAGLLDRLAGDRVGLVIYAGDAFTRFPLTRDLGAARELIDAMLPGERLVPPGSNVAAAIAQSLALLETSQAQTRAILVVGDGESLTGDALAAAAAAATRGVRIFSAGVGTEAGATIPVVNRNTAQVVPKIDATTGDPVITRLDAAALTALATSGAGRFLRLDLPGALSDLASDLNALDASTFRVTTERSPIERFQIPLAIALLLLLLEPLIATRRTPRDGEIHPATADVAQPGSNGNRRRRFLFVGLLPLIALGLAACSSFSADRNADGNRAFEEGHFADAVDAYSEALAQDPTEARLALNLARALHELNDFEAAIAASRSALRTDDDALAARAFYQLGNSQFDRPDLIGARSAYIEALLLDPTDIDTKVNLEIVNALLSTLPSAPGDGEAPRPPGEGAGGTGDGDGDADGDPTGTGEPTDTAPGRPAGRAPVEGAEQSGVPTGEAQANLESAIDAFDRDNPTAAEALAILEALRELDEAERAGSGILGVEVAGDNDY